MPLLIRTAADINPSPNAQAISPPESYLSTYLVIRIQGPRSTRMPCPTKTILHKLKDRVIQRRRYETEPKPHFEPYIVIKLQTGLPYPRAAPHTKRASVDSWPLP
jgi:hypothetical protein